MEDLIIMLVIFGVISSFTKKSKKPQGKRPATSNYPKMTPPNNSRTGTMQTKLNEVAKADNLQGGLASLFNMLVGEEVLKDRKTIDNEHLNKVQLDEIEKRSEQEAVETYEIARRLESEARDKDNMDENEALQIEMLDESIQGESGSAASAPLIINLSEVQKGIIWHEILDKPKALKH